MRSLDGRLVADLNDNVPANITGSVDALATSSIDENTTSYALLPQRINAVPYVSTSIYNTSSPQIKPIQYNEPGRDNLFIDTQGAVKVAVGSDFILKFLAEQPSIYNIENGIPTIYVDQTQLVYGWQKDGTVITSDSDLNRPESYVTSNNNELRFTNVSPKFAGTYVCVSSNDIGSTESEQIVLEVYNPDIEDLFYKNLVDNPYGKTGLDGWTSDQEIIVNKLSNGSYKNFSQPWRTDLFGYSLDMFYPRPYHLNTYHIKNSNLTQDLLQEGSYFSRERFKYRVKDGKAVLSATYEVDLTNVQEYIQSAVFGVEGVRAVFGCYIGNAISKYKTTLLNALITRRSSKYSLLPNLTRLHISNCLLAGIPVKFEQAKVTIQEFDNETPLLSLVNGSLVPGFSFIDPLLRAEYELNSQTIKAAPISPGNTQADKLIYAAGSGSLGELPATFGQKVEWNRVVIDKLNFRTTKLRISILFEAFPDVLNLTDKNYLTASDECFEFTPWEWITKPNHWPLLPDVDFALSGSSGVQWNLDQFSKLLLNIKDDEPFRYATQLGTPRVLATGFNVILFPLEKKAPLKATYYTNTILAPVNTNLTYPTLQVGTSPTSALGTYFGQLSDYDYEIIGVNITNRYNWPFNGDEIEDYIEAFKARGEPATRTTVQTFKYNKNHTVEFPEVLDFSSAIWEPFELLSDLNFTANSGFNYEFTLAYNSGSVDLIDANIEQVVGNIQSNIIKYTNNLVTVVPAGFQTQSLFKDSYLSDNTSIGFTLNLVGEDYGVYETESIEPGPAFKKEALKDWRELKQVTNYDHYYSVLQKVDQPGAPAAASKQHLIYSNEFNDNWWETENTLSNQSRLPLSTQNQISSYGEFDPKLNLASIFNFKQTSYYEHAMTTQGIGSTAADAKQKAIDLDIQLNMQYNEVDVNGALQDMKPAYVSYGSSVGGYTYTFYKAGRTRDVVKLNSVRSNGIKTPAAIIIPSDTKIYYFIYNYVDNSRNEI